MIPKKWLHWEFELHGSSKEYMESGEQDTFYILCWATYQNFYFTLIEDYMKDPLLKFGPCIIKTKEVNWPGHIYILYTRTHFISLVKPHFKTMKLCCISPKKNGSFYIIQLSHWKKLWAQNILMETICIPMTAQRKKCPLSAVFRSFEMNVSV